MLTDNKIFPSYGSQLGSDTGKSIWRQLGGLLLGFEYIARYQNAHEEVICCGVDRKVAN